VYIHKKYSEYSILLVHDVHTYCLRMNYFIRPLILVPRECRTRTRPAKSENQGRLLHEDEASWEKTIEPIPKMGPPFESTYSTNYNIFCAYISPANICHESFLVYSWRFLSMYENGMNSNPSITALVSFLLANFLDSLVRRMEWFGSLVHFNWK
jgi:hypothetical protein